MPSQSFSSWGEAPYAKRLSSIQIYARTTTLATGTHTLLVILFPRARAKGSRCIDLPRGCGLSLSPCRSIEKKHENRWFLNILCQATVGLKSTQNSQNRPKVGPKLAQSWPQVGPKSTQSRSKVGLKLARSRPKVGPKSARSRPKVGTTSA